MTASRRDSRHSKRKPTGSHKAKPLPSKEFSTSISSVSSEPTPILESSLASSYQKHVLRRHQPNRTSRRHGGASGRGPRGDSPFTPRRPVGAVPELFVTFRHVSLAVDIPVSPAAAAAAAQAASGQMGRETLAAKQLPTITNHVRGIVGGLTATKTFVRRQILKNVTGAFTPGSMTLLLGRSGSGKSMLLKLLGGRRGATALGNSPLQERLLPPQKSNKSRKMPLVPYAIGIRAAPIVATTVVIATLITCVSVAKAKDIYLGGLAWPYFSDTGRDPPGYTIFCVGLTTVAVALILTWVTNYEFQRELVERGCRDNTDNHYAATIRKYSEVVRVLGVLSAFGLPILAFFSTTSYPDVHKYAAYWFFVLEAIALVINTIASFKLARLTSASKPYYTSEEPEVPLSSTNVFNPWNDPKSSTKRTFYIQVVFTTLFWIGFLLYIPIGLALIDDFQRLTIQDCVDLNLGDKYCTDTMKLNNTDTVLWNYDNNHGLNQMRSASQLACILTLVGYSMSFLSHSSESLQDDAV
ncbi:Transposon-encoded protein [Phytophthora cinnamomi]|uniref:Transposon-encoded protein n=1 Tax=Phytophthora cinnamomi TaxID=4785 RepID=UPI003559597A|nr:Transposon-encoded protein [Phytophthora cinnamomi]